MKIRYLLFTTLMSLLCAAPTRAQQGWSGETEIGTNGQGHPFFSQYVFYDTKDGNVLVRYFWVKGQLNRVELAYGPTFKVKVATVKLQFGGTTDKDVMVAATVVAKMAGRSILYIADAKISTTERPSTLYQKGFVALNKKETFQFRAEHLQVGSTQGFLRIGAEYQHALPEKTQLFVAPFYDPINKGFGLNAGFRFF